MVTFVARVDVGRFEEGDVPATDATPSRWRGIPLDERQAERRRILVDTAFDLLGTIGVAGTTVRGVCEAAALNPRYFYESFEDLDDLLVAVFDRTAEDGLGVILEAVAATADADPLTRTRAVMDGFLRFITDDPRRAQVLYVAGLGNEALARRRLEAMLGMADLFASGGPAGAEATAEPGAVDPIGKVAASLVVGGMSELVMTWLQGRVDLTLDQLIEDASILFVALGEAASGVAESRTAPAPTRRR
jgi:AcrR family transcriptional regulator